jgi:hypothetical protein
MIHLVNDVIEWNVVFHAMPLHTIFIMVAKVSGYYEMPGRKGMVVQVVTIIAFSPGQRKEDDDTSRPEIMIASSLSCYWSTVVFTIFYPVCVSFAFLHYPFRCLIFNGFHLL